MMNIRPSALVVALLLTGCASAPPDRSLPAEKTPAAAPAPLRRSAVIAPAAGGVMTGDASYYADRFHGRLTASGERFDIHAHTAAHRTLAFGTRVRVTHLASGRWTIVRITDRGPFVAGRIIDLSPAAAGDLGMLEDGVAPVRLEILPAPLADAGG